MCVRHVTVRCKRKTAELEDDKAKFHTHIGSLEVCLAVAVIWCMCDHS